MDFSDDQMEYLWDLYKNDSKKWKFLCKLLGSSRMQKDEIMKIGRNIAINGDRRKRVFYVPISCQDSIEVIINQLKRDGILDNQSVISPVAEDMSRLTVNCNDRLAFAIGKMISKPERLMDKDSISIEKNNKKYFVVDFSLLAIPDTDKGNMENILGDIDKQVKGNTQDDKEKKRQIKKILKDDEALLRELQEKGYLHFLNISDEGIGFTYGSHAIKSILVDEGKMLEMRVSNELEHLGGMTNIVNGITFYHEDGLAVEDELDCLVTKEFKSLIVECKSKETVSDIDLKNFTDKLYSRTKRFAVNGMGLLLIDSPNPLPTYKTPDSIRIIRVDDILGKKRYKIGMFIKSFF